MTKSLLQVHEHNIDVAYRQLMTREQQGENMDRAYVDERTYEIKFSSTPVLLIKKGRE